MAVFDDKFITGEKSAITNGTRKVTFDTPSDYADWLADHYGEDLARWQWCKP